MRAGDVHGALAARTWSCLGARVSPLPKAMQTLPAEVTRGLGGRLVAERSSSVDASRFRLSKEGRETSLVGLNSLRWASRAAGGPY